MKTKIIFIFIILSLITNESISQSGWFQQNSGTNCDFADAYFLNSLTGFVVGLDTPSVIKTTNGGLNWYSQFTGNIGSDVSIQFLDSNTGFVVSSSFSYRTTNGGINWSIIPNISGCNDVMFVNFQTGYIAAYGSQVKKTTNNGVNWTNINVPTSQSFYKVFAINSEEVYFASWNYLFKTTNGGVNFLQLANYSQDISIFFLNSITGFIAGESSIGKTSNGGLDFVTKLYNDGMYFRNIQMINQNTGFAVGNIQSTNQLGVIYKTINSGENWSHVHTEGIYLTGFHFPNETTGYMIGLDGKILKTTTGGERITHSVGGVVRFEDNNQPVTSGRVKAVKYDYQTQQIIKLDSAIIQSNGSYILTNVPQDSVDVMAFQDDEDNNEFVPTYYPSTIYWQNSATLYPTSNLSNININVFRNSSSTSSLHIGGKVTGTYNSDNANLTDVFVYARIGNMYKGYSVSNTNALYEINKLNPGSYEIIADKMGYNPVSRNIQLINSSFDNIDLSMLNYVIAVEPISEVIPESYSLSQNFPNPFNPVTKISFEIPLLSGHYGNTTLKIYDVLGREVQTLVNEFLKPGKYVIDLDAGNYPSGFYFYRLSSGEYSECKKMILVK